MKPDFEEIIRDAVNTAVLDMDVEALMELVRPRPLVNLPIEPTGDMIHAGAVALCNDLGTGLRFDSLDAPNQRRYMADAGNIWDAMVEAYIATNGQELTL